jgi:lipooligosaccharide transport system permease protein
MIGVVRQFDYWSTVYRRTWKGNAISSFLMPALYLLAMGVGLGSYVDDRALGGTSYLAFVAPGLMAATAMQVGIFEGTYPVMSGLKWQKFFHSMIATPLRPADVAYGQLGFIAFRVLTTCAVFAVVMTVLGAMGSWLGILTVPVALLVGMAYGAPVVALSSQLTNPAGFSLVFRLGMVPMFLFSGAFFPVSQLPDPVEWLAYLMPLWHGVELSRGFALGDIGLAAVAGHTAYLLVWFVAGTRLSTIGMTRRLIR